VVFWFVAAPFPVVNPGIQLVFATLEVAQFGQFSDFAVSHVVIVAIFTIAFFWAFRFWRVQPSVVGRVGPWGIK